MVSDVFLASFTTGHWQANCYIAAAPGLAQCVIIDPGQGSAGAVTEFIAEHRLEPRAILLTHGHFDHVADACAVAEEYGIVTYIHKADRHLLSHPSDGLSPEGALMVKTLVGPSMPEPPRVEYYRPNQDLAVAGLNFSVTEAPGHTAGSVLLSVAFSGHPAIRRLMFTGDVVFAGAVGRTDLPGGDHPAMLRTLQKFVTEVSDDVALLPGHGEQTTMPEERRSNPFLQSDFLGS